MAVLRFVLITLALTHVTAILVSDLLQMVVTAMVSLLIFIMCGVKCYQYADIDECAEGTSGCRQVCENTSGSYTCSCQLGYRLASDNRICDG